MSTVTVRAVEGHTIRISGVVDIVSSIGHPARAVIKFGDGTVLDVDIHGQITRHTQGVGFSGRTGNDSDGDTFIVSGDLLNVRLRHGGNDQGCEIR
jgi:hypothetical protein